MIDKGHAGVAGHTANNIKVAFNRSDRGNGTTWRGTIASSRPLGLKPHSPSVDATTGSREANWKCDAKVCLGGAILGRFSPNEGNRTCVH